MVRHGVQSEAAAFIQKPFALEDCSRKVRAALDAATPDEASEAA